MFEPARQNKTTDIIIEKIRAAILDGKLQPGDRLPPEKELGEQFSVSKQTMRESLRALDLSGELRITRKLKYTKPRAGKLLKASVEVAPPAADVGSRGTVFCEAEISDKRVLKPLRESLKALPSGSDRARCTWRIPRNARGEEINFLLHVVYQHGGVRRDVTALVRR